MDLMLNLLESQTNWLAQVVHEVLSKDEPHEPLEHLKCVKTKINQFRKYSKNSSRNMN